MHLFSLPKKGKSRMAASICKVPGIENVLVVDIDKGAAAFAKLFPEVQVIRFKKGDIDGFQNFWDELVRNDGMYEGVQFDAVVLDTMSILQKWKVKSIPDGDGFAKWREVADWTLQLAWDLHEMTPVGLMLFHVEMVNIMKGGGEDAEFTLLSPSLQGSAKLQIGAVPDLIGYLSVQDDPKSDDPIYTIQLKPSERTNTGNRFPELPAIIKTDGGMKRLYEYIDGKAK